jgi:hypothetical protein
LSRTRPWEAEGISRRTWYRRHAAAVGTTSCPADSCLAGHEVVPGDAVKRTPEGGGPRASAPVGSAVASERAGRSVLTTRWRGVGREFPPSWLSAKFSAIHESTI